MSASDAAATPEAIYAEPSSRFDPYLQQIPPNVSMCNPTGPSSGALRCAGNRDLVLAFLG